MDDAAIAVAIATRLQAVTPPTGETAIRWASHELTDDATPPRPALEILPPAEETLEWLPARQMRSVATWTVQLLLESGSDLPRRMRSLYAWRTALRTQLAGKIQLGVTGVEGAYLRGLGTPEDEFGQQLIDVLELSIEVTVREVVSTISA